MYIGLLVFREVCVCVCVCVRVCQSWRLCSGTGVTGFPDGALAETDAIGTVSVRVRMLAYKLSGIP